LASWLDKFAGEGDPLVEQPGSCAAADGGARLVQEWREFEEHFEKRKLELGTCGRPYGTPCAHE
jgi:hypothetical protein